jgi:group II intron reverse transcriptase/maturase
MSVPSAILMLEGAVNHHQHAPTPTTGCTPHEHPDTRLQEEQYEAPVPSVRDRIVQAAVKIVLEPVFETQFLSCSFGFRHRRSAHDALQVLIEESWRGRRWVVETDIANCFSAIPHEELMQAVQERVCDQAVLKLLRVMLRAGVMEHGLVRREVTGSPQGGVISPLLCNVYLHRLDRAWSTREHGVLVRYADDGVPRTLKEVPV